MKGSDKYKKESANERSSQPSDTAKPVLLTISITVVSCVCEGMAMGNGEGNTIGDVCKGKIKPKSGIPERDFSFNKHRFVWENVYLTAAYLFLSA